MNAESTWHIGQVDLVCNLVALASKRACKDDINESKINRILPYQLPLSGSTNTFAEA